MYYSCIYVELLLKLREWLLVTSVEDNRYGSKALQVQLWHRTIWHNTFLFLLLSAGFDLILLILKTPLISDCQHYSYSSLK